jgi:hypothetical protein
MNHFLKAILESGQSLSLSSFEYCLDKYLLFNNDEGRYEYQDLKLVFGLAPKLTDLFLLIPGPTDTLDRSSAIKGIGLTDKNVLAVTITSALTTKKTLPTYHFPRRVSQD